MALGCVHALRLVGRYAPHDVSVIGFDDLPEVEHVWPPLTTMRQDFNQLGVDVLETVLGLVGAAPLSSRLQHTPELIVRESTGPVMSPPRG
jgi:DNA-binding LacI/PurR family transcriptional regulator